MWTKGTNCTFFSLTVQLKVCQLLKGSTREQPVVSSDTSGKGVKLPKIDVPTFDGNILNWQSFWEQFSVSIHDRDSLLNSIGEVGIHVPPALPQGWSSKACYWRAFSLWRLIAFLRHDHPRVIHQNHVKMIMEAPVLKDCSGRELRHLHDTVQQHLCALNGVTTFRTLHHLHVRAEVRCEHDVWMAET